MAISHVATPTNHDEWMNDAFIWHKKFQFITGGFKHS